MKWSIFFCIIYFPLHMMSQGDRSEVIVFRNTGMLKSAVPCWVEIGENEKERLGNKTILIVDVSAAGRLKMKVSLEKHGREYVFRVPERDTLFLAVELYSGRGGALPSSRIRAGLRLVSRGEAHAILRKKWAVKAVESNGIEK